MEQEILLTVLMPCLNEAETLATCITKAQKSIAELQISGEVLIADNGSTDGSQQIAREHGARVVDIPEKGYGSALIGGIHAAKGKYIIMGDADDSYDFLSLRPFVEKLEEGYELVMGNRFKGGIAKGAMPPLHRYLGNPVLSGIGTYLVMLGSATTVSCFVMARNMGHEGTLSSGVIMMTTLLSAFTLTMWLDVLRSFGLV